MCNWDAGGHEETEEYHLPRIPATHPHPDSLSDGTHSLQRIYCWDIDGMLHFSKSDEETNWPAPVSSSSSSRVTGSPVHPRLHVGLVWIGLGGKLLLSSKLSRVHTSITSRHRVHVAVWVHHGVSQHLNTHIHTLWHALKQQHVLWTVLNTLSPDSVMYWWHPIQWSPRKQNPAADWCFVARRRSHIEMVHHYGD